MKIKITMRYHFAPTGMAVIKKTGNNKCWWKCGENEILVPCWWDCKMVQPLWKTVWKFLKRLSSYHPTQQFYSLVCNQEKWKHACTKICTSGLIELFMIAKKVETTQMSMDWRADKQNVQWTYHGIILSHRKDWSTNTWNNIGERWNVILTEKKPHKKSYIVEFHLREMSRIAKSIETESRLAVAGGSREGGMEGDSWWLQGFLSGW